MGKSKRSAVRALDWLVARGVEVAAVVAPEDEPEPHPDQRARPGRAAATGCRW